MKRLVVHGNERHNGGKFKVVPPEEVAEILNRHLTPTG